MIQERNEIEYQDYLDLSSQINDSFEGLKLALSVIADPVDGIEYEVAIDDARRHTEAIIDRHEGLIEKVVRLKAQLDPRYSFESDHIIQQVMKHLGWLHSQLQKFRLKQVEWEVSGTYHSIEMQ